MNPLMITAIAAMLLLLFAKRRPQASTVAADSQQDGTAVEQPSQAEIARVIRSIRDSYGQAIARNVERIYRLETAHFSSGQFRRTNTAGMIAVNGRTEWPFGWPKRGTDPTMFAPIVWMAENAGGAPKPFIAFIRFEDAARYLAQFLKDHANNAGRWFSTVPAQQTAYEQRLNGIDTPLADG